MSEKEFRIGKKRHFTWTSSLPFTCLMCSYISEKKWTEFLRDCVCVNQEWRWSDQENFFRSVPNNDLQVRLLFSFLFTASLFRLRYSLFLEFLVSLHRPRDNSRYFFFLHFTSWTIACKTLCIAFYDFLDHPVTRFSGKWSSRTFNARKYLWIISLLLLHLFPLDWFFLELFSRIPFDLFAFNSP